MYERQHDQQRSATQDDARVIVGLGGAAILPFTGTATTASAAPHDTQTVVTFYTIVGTDGDDVIYGGSGDDVIDSGHGDDTVRGQPGENELMGGHGDDWPVGGDDRNRLFGGSGSDHSFGHGGKDGLLGDVDNADPIVSSKDPGQDVLFGGDGHDPLAGGDSADRLYGEDGNDNRTGDSGNDHVFGMDGDKHLRGVDGYRSRGRSERVRPAVGRRRSRRDVCWRGRGGKRDPLMFSARENRSKKISG